MSKVMRWMDKEMSPRQLVWMIFTMYAVFPVVIASVLLLITPSLPWAVIPVVGAMCYFTGGIIENIRRS